MRPTFLCLATAAALLAGPALAQNLRTSADSAAGRRAELKAEEAAVNNDWADVVAEAARAYQVSPSVENEFNLAVGYENTGRPTLAIPLYRDVAARGQMAVGHALYDYRRTPGPEHKSFFLSDVAASRLYALTGVKVRPGE